MGGQQAPRVPAGGQAGGQAGGGPQGLHERISLEFSHSWPGQAYLRFEARGGPAVMVAVNGADLAVLAALAGGG